MFVPFYTNQNHKVNFIFLVFFCSLRNMENVFGSSGQSSKLVREYLKFCKEPILYYFFYMYPNQIINY